MYNTLILVLMLNIGLIHTKSDINTIVETEFGKIQGKVYNEYISFHSVPYAEPPIHENRFESPKPIQKNWTGILDCTEFASPCLQWNHFNFNENRLSGDEDCLYLNIYTPNLNFSKLFPVIIYIHGGAFQYGTGNVFGPDLIMKTKDAVVVTIAYRLGPLGFLSTGDQEIPGNLGLKDQRLALAWIKKNIKNFGGDPNHIILTGFSAGGASVHLHLLSDNTANIISSAVSFSGTAFCPWVMVNNPIEKTKKLASILNCTTDNSKLLKACLKQKPAQLIVKTVGNFQFSQYFPFRIFGPVIEPNTIEDAFIKEDLEKLIKLNKTEPVPWIVAYTADDGGYSAADLMQKTNTGVEYIENFWENFDEFASKALFYDETLTAEESKQYSIFLRQKYNLKNEDTNLEKYFKIQKIFTDELFLKGLLKAVKLHKKFGNSPVFGYMYDNPSPLGIGNVISHRNDINYGCTHGDDVFLMFNVPHRDMNPLRDDELKLSEKFIEMLKIFATTGLAKFGDTDFPENSKNGDIQLLKITRNSTSTILFDNN